MKKLFHILGLLAVLTAGPALAQQAQEFGDYKVYYNALNSSLISPSVAKVYGIRRSDSRGLINIAVKHKDSDGNEAAVKAAVTASARNLTGQTRNIDMREIDDGDDAVYYIGELSVRNQETFDFTVLITPEGAVKPFSVTFRQQFFTE